MSGFNELSDGMAVGEFICCRIPEINALMIFARKDEKTWIALQHDGAGVIKSIGSISEPPHMVDESKIEITDVRDDAQRLLAAAFKFLDAPHVPYHQAVGKPSPPCIRPWRRTSTVTIQSRRKPPSRVCPLQTMTT